MVIAIGFAVVSSYAFSRYRFKGRNGILKLLLLLNAFPQILSMFALFRLLKQMNMLDTKLGLVIIYAGSMCIFSIWNMKGYFDTIPVEIEEASKIDGASDFQLLWKVVMPLARPAIIVTSVMVLIFVWNEYLFSTTFLLNENSYTLAGGLYQLQSSDYTRSWGMFSAVAIADRVGHESIDITYRYSHLFPSKQVAMADRLDAVNASFEDCEEQDDDVEIMQTEETAPMIDMDAAAEKIISIDKYKAV